MAESSPFESSDNTEQLIHLYFEHPCLWKVTDLTYKDRYKRDAAYRIIGNELKIEATEVKVRLKKLRTQFLQEKKKLLKRKTGSGADEVKSTKWKWFSALSFLSDSINQRPTKSTLV